MPFLKREKRSKIKRKRGKNTLINKGGETD